MVLTYAPMERHNFNLRNGQFKRLQAMAKRTDISTSEHIRTAVEQYLQDYESHPDNVVHQAKRGCRRGE